MALSSMSDARDESLRFYLPHAPSPSSSHVLETIFSTDTMSHTDAQPFSPPHWQSALDHSRWLRMQFAAHPGLTREILAEAPPANRLPPLDEALLKHWLAAQPCPDDDTLKRHLRQVRRRAMAHLMLRDLTEHAPLAEIVESMTLLADLTTDFAHEHLHTRLAEQYGRPLDSQGQPQRMIIVGMGKLGGRELNVSSDIDPIFLYREEGPTEGGRIDAYDFFTRLGKRLIAALGEPTGDGQVFRVDMRLRPNGDSGPLVCSLDALENYFITQGREWERYAWIKARVLNPGMLDEATLKQLESTRRPFVFRRYLDFGAINAMRDLHAQIRREVARKDMADHIKLGPGGIREIEFIAQAFQLIRGGRDTALQIRPTLQVLRVAEQMKLLESTTVRDLEAAYDFLRRLEHRLQYMDDAQTHRLPENDADRQLIALSMDCPDWTALLELLNGHRAKVSAQFETVFGEPETTRESPAIGLWTESLDDETALQRWGVFGFIDPAAAQATLRTLRASARYQQLPASNRERLDALGPRLIEAASLTPQPDATFTRGLNFLDAICRRGAYLALLQQYPQALRKLSEMVGGSTWAAEYLTRHPIVLDELLGPKLYDMATDWQGFTTELNEKLAEYPDDAERQMDILREMHHAQVFRILAQDLAGMYTVEKLSDHLSQLADIILDATLRRCWDKLRTKHCEVPKFAIVGYGKLGGKELGYASDLDMVFLYEDDDPSAQQNYARLAQRLTTWLGSQTSAGILFETDLRLRPNGDAGLLVSTVEAFRDYQQHQAWPWEHQALTRARYCAGDAAIGQKFDAVRDEVLRQPRDPAKLKDEVLAMRQKMLDNHASNSETDFDLKQDPGGIIDVEFIVQYLVLANAHTYPQLTGNLGNIALLRIAAELGLIPEERAKPVRDAYREYRRHQHAKRLNGATKAKELRTEHQERTASVRSLWSTVFGQ